MTIDGAPAQWPWLRADAATWLFLYLVFLLIIPAPLVITALGQVGGPSTVIALALFAYYCATALYGPQFVPPGATAVRTAALLLLLVSWAVYAHSMWLPLPADERSPADAMLLRMMGFVGVVCVTATRIPSRESLWRLTERLALLTGALSALAVAQMVTGEEFIDRVSFPGLSGTFGDNLQARGVFVRPSGTSTHPIEFAAVVSMGLPFALAVLSHPTRRPRLLRVAALLSGLVVLMTGSRTAIVCGAIAFLAMLPAWSRRAQMLSLAAVALMVAILFVAMPGFVGTMRGLFQGASNDSSVQSRTASYTIAEEFMSHQWWLGRGLGTFLPRYWIFDNQYLGLLVGAGVLGLAAVIFIVLTAVRSATRAARGLGEDGDRQLAIAARAAALAGAASLALFDVFGFAQAVGMFFFAIGMCGAVHLLRVRPAPSVTSTGERAHRATRPLHSGRTPPIGKRSSATPDSLDLQR